MDDSGAQRKIDALVANFFSAFDNRDGAVPRLADLINCFTDKATIVRRSDSGAELYTVREFALPRIELLTQGALLRFHASARPRYLGPWPRVDSLESFDRRSWTGGNECT